MRNLRGQRRRDGDEVQVLATVVDRHLPAFAEVISVGIALRHEHVQGEPTVHKYSYAPTNDVDSLASEPPQKMMYLVFLLYVCNL